MTVTTLRVLTPEKATDWTVPSGDPIKEWIATAAGENVKPDGTSWTITVAGGVPVRREQSLDDARIVDGTEVILTPVYATERYQKVAEDIADYVAIAQTDPRFGRPDLISWLAYCAAAVLVGVAGAGVFGWAAARTWWWGPILITVGLVCVVAARGLGRRGWPQLQAGVGVGAITNLVVGAGLAVPLPRGAHWLAAPQYAAGAAMLVACLLLQPGGPGGWRPISAFLATTGVIGFAAAVGTGFGWAHWVWPMLVLTGLLLIKDAAKLVRRFARIALPPVPRPGDEISMEQLDPTAAVDVKDRALWERIEATVPSSAVRLAERCTLTQHLLAGFIAAGAAALAVGTVVLWQRGHYLPHTTVLCILVVAVLGFRVRLPADRRAASALLTGAAAVLAGMAGKALWWWPSWAPLTIGLLIVGLVVGVAAVLATDGLHPGQIQRRWLEHAETLSLGSIIFMLSWASGLLDALRNLTLGG
jgi:type VII secretion integral membrane protein EccD